MSYNLTSEQDPITTLPLPINQQATIIYQHHIFLCEYRWLNHVQLPCLNRVPLLFDGENP